MCPLDNFNKSNNVVSTHQFPRVTETFMCGHSVFTLQQPSFDWLNLSCVSMSFSAAFLGQNVTFN